MEGDVPQAPEVSVAQKVKTEVKDVPQTLQQPPVVPQTPSESTLPAKPNKKLKLKILAILIIALVGLGMGGFFVWKYFFASETSVPLLERIVNRKKEEEISIYKGVWMPTIIFQDENYIELNAQKLKDIGINTIFIQGSPSQPEVWLEKIKDRAPPELIERVKEVLPVEKEYIIDKIEQSHRNGFKVALTVSNPPDLQGMDMDLLNARIVEYAELAQEYDVELFAPMNEPGTIFGANTGKWRQEILPKIKEVYHGDVLWKGAGLGLPKEPLTDEFFKKIAEGKPGDRSGYDYLGFSTMFIPKDKMEPHELIQFADMLTLEDYAKNVENTIKYALALAERDNCKGVIISEFGVLDEESLTQEEIARAYEIVLEKGQGKVDGFIALDFFEVKMLGVHVEEKVKTTEVVKKWFTEILPEKKMISY
jgi:hypothetical protein